VGVFRRIAVFIVLTMWFGAAHHCDAEIAFDLCDQAMCCTSPAGCAQDGCETVESGDYRIAETNLKTPAPILVWVSLFNAAAIETAAARPVVLASEKLTEWPLDWVPSWHFVRRAAPPSRAPSLVLA